MSEAFSYYSGIPTFEMMLGIAMVAILIFLVGMILNMKKWGGGSIKVFLSAFIKSATKDGHQSILTTLVLDILLQRRILRRSPFRWIMHMLIFIGWGGMLVLSLIFAAFEMFQKIGIGSSDLNAVRNGFDAPNEILGYLLLIGIIIAIVRRLALSEVSKRSQVFDWVLVLGILFITLTGFIAEGFRPDAISAWTFLGANMAEAEAMVLAKTLSLFHVVISLLFCIAYIPFSKYMHMIAAPLVIIANGGGE
ncbi:MAG: respiratory nitrate reductase subunit gamma [ANME-2 cluster archaeon]|nr:respiratory nitrate reductase subunit gamma [ANME-2 cluster archaeon]